MSEKVVERERPLDGLKGIIPQPLRAEAKVQIELPPEARALMNDAHNDRVWVGGFIAFVALMALLLLGAATAKYVLSNLR